MSKGLANKLMLTFFSEKTQNFAPRKVIVITKLNKVQTNFNAFQ